MVDWGFASSPFDASFSDSDPCSGASSSDAIRVKPLVEHPEIWIGRAESPGSFNPATFTLIWCAGRVRRLFGASNNLATENGRVRGSTKADGKWKVAKMHNVMLICIT